MCRHLWLFAWACAHWALGASAFGGAASGDLGLSSFTDTESRSTITYTDQTSLFELVVKGPDGDGDAFSLRLENKGASDPDPHASVGDEVVLTLSFGKPGELDVKISLSKVDSKALILSIEPSSDAEMTQQWAQRLHEGSVWMGKFLGRVPNEPRPERLPERANKRAVVGLAFLQYLGGGIGKGFKFRTVVGQKVILGSVDTKNYADEERPFFWDIEPDKPPEGHGGPGQGEYFWDIEEEKPTEAPIDWSDTCKLPGWGDVHYKNTLEPHCPVPSSIWEKDEDIIGFCPKIGHLKWANYYFHLPEQPSGLTLYRIAWKRYYGVISDMCTGRCGPGCAWWDVNFYKDCLDHDSCVDHNGGDATFDNPNCYSEVLSGIDDVAYSTFFGYSC